MILYHAPTHRRSLLPSSVRRNDSLNIMACFEQPQYTPLMNDLDYLNENFQMIISYSFAKLYPRTSVVNFPMSYFPLELFSPSEVISQGCLHRFITESRNHLWKSSGMEF